MEDVGPSGSTDDGLQRGPWAEWEDELLAKYVAKYGEGNWASVKEKLDIGLKRCGKSCRLRYLNHLKPGLKKGAFSEDEEDLIFTLHAYYGNKWSRIALELPGRTDNEIKNFFHYKCKKLENAKLPVPGQSAADKARARAFVQSRLSAGEPSASLFPAERSSDSLLGKRGLEEAPEHEVKHQKTEAGRTGSGVPPGSQPGNSNITLRVPIIGPPKPLRFAHASLAEKAKPAPRLKRPMSSKNLESAGKLAQTAIDAARAAASIGVGPDDAALVAAASVHRNNLMDTKPSDSVAHMMTGVARLAAEAVLPRANSAGVDARGGQRFPMQMPLGFLQQQQRLELLAQLYSASERQGLKVQQQVAALFPASPVSILDVAQLEPQQRQLLEAQARAMLLARGGMLSRQASEPARLDALRLAAEIEAAGRMQAGESIPAAGGLQAAGTARPSQLTEDRLGELFERAAAFLRPKQEVGFEDEERSFDRREAAAQGGGRQSAWVQEVHQQEEEGQREDDANAVDEERKGKQGSATPLSHLERAEIDKKPGIVFGRGDEGSIGSEDVRSEGGSLLGPKMRAFKELRRPHLDILGQAEDPEPGPLTAAVGRHISPSESTAQTPRGWMWSPRLSAGRKKWAGPIWKTVNGHSVDISELSPDYVSELWGLDAETFACKTPTLSLFPGAISDEEAFSLSERGPSFTRSPSGSDGPWLPWPYDGKPVTRDEVSGKLVSPRTVMEAIESGPLSARTPRDSSDNELPSDGLGSRGSGLAPQWWLSMIGTPHDQAKIGTLRDQPQEDRQHGQEQDGGEREAGKGDGMAALEERDVEGPIRLEREEPAFREASLEVAEGKGDESEGRGGVVEGGKSWPSLKGKHRPSSSFSFSPLAPPLEGFATEEHGKEAGGPPAPETGPQPQQAGSSPKPASLLEQVCSLFSRPNGPPRNPE